MTVCQSGCPMHSLLAECAIPSECHVVSLLPKAARLFSSCTSCLTLGPSPTAAPKPDPGMLAAMHKYVNINPEEFPAAMVERLQLQRLLPLAIDRAIFENLPALSERASSVACNTTAELILKVLPRRDGSRLLPSMQRSWLPTGKRLNVSVQHSMPCGPVWHIASPNGHTVVGSD